jgi:hypothetical protein
MNSFRHTCASLLFAPVEQGGGGKNAKQVQEWLGHHSPAYTLKEYVHLIDAGVGDATFLDELFEQPEHRHRHRTAAHAGGAITFLSNRRHSPVRGADSKGS